MFGLIGSALSTLGGLFGSFFNASMQSVQNSKNIKYQIIENEKNRQFNSAQAAIARNFSANFAREMYDKQYRDNSYSSQVAQMKAAGINPALAYSAGNFAGASMPSASSPSASSSGSVSSQVAPQIDPSYMADIALKAAQIENINAQTKKTESETEGQGYTNKILESDASFRDAYNSGVINLQNVEFDKGQSNINLTNQQAANLRREFYILDVECEKLFAEIDLLHSTMKNVNADTIGKTIDNYFKSDYWNATIDNIAAASSKSRAEVEAIMRKLPFEIQKLGAEAALDNAIASIQPSLGRKYEADVKESNSKIKLNAKLTDESKERKLLIRAETKDTSIDYELLQNEGSIARSIRRAAAGLRGRFSR